MFGISSITVDFYEVILFDWQQKLASFLYLSVNSWNVSVSIIVFLLGFLTSFSPCMLSVFPLIFAYLNSRQKDENIIDKNFFFFGFFSSFLFVLFLVNFFSTYTLLRKIPILSSCILLLVSLNFLQILEYSSPINLMYRWISIFKTNIIFIESYLTGFLLGISSLPCNTSVIFFVTFWLSNSITFFKFLFYLILYILGYFFLLIVILNIRINYKNVSFLSKVLNVLFPVSGSFLFINSLLSLLKNIFI